MATTPSRRGGRDTQRRRSSALRQRRRSGGPGVRAARGTAAVAQKEGHVARTAKVVVSYVVPDNKQHIRRLQLLGTWNGRREQHHAHHTRLAGTKGRLGVPQITKAVDRGTREWRGLLVLDSTCFES